MNKDRFNAEEMIEDCNEANELREIDYETEGTDCQESEESDNKSAIAYILKRIGAACAIIGTMIVFYKCRGCMTKWAVRMLQKRGYTVILPGQNVIETEKEPVAEDQYDAYLESEDTEE